MPIQRWTRAPWVVAALAAASCGTSPIVDTAALPGGGGSALSPGSSTPAPSAAAAGSPGSSAPPASLTFGPCADGNAPARAVCGNLSVPLDYSDASKGTIALAVVKVPATDQAHRIGSLLLNPGGPGASGVDFVEGSTADLATLNIRFDLIGFDPRGTTGNDAVSCETTEQLDAFNAADPILDDATEKQQFVDVSKLMADSCKQKSGRLLPYLGTDNVARDMDRLRAALGDAKLTYLGFSYGTAIGQHYAAMFPTHVRAMVLDGDDIGSNDILSELVQQANSIEDNYREFLRRCAALGTRCPIGTDPAAAVGSLLQKLDANPVQAPDGRSIGRGLMLAALLPSVYYVNEWDIGWEAVGQAVHGDFTDALLLNDEFEGRTNSGYDHEIEAFNAITCADEDAPTDLTAYDAAAARAQSSAPEFGAADVYGLLPCAYWPNHGPAPSAHEVKGAPPIVLIGATHDPATPYAWSQTMQKQIQGSVLLTRDGYGHTSYDNSQCIRGHVDSYLTNLTVPPSGVTCPTD